MGVTELFLSLPWLYFLLGVRAFLPLHLSTLRTFFLLTGVIGLIGWARPARLVRGVVLSCAKPSLRSGGARLRRDLTFISCGSIFCRSFRQYCLLRRRFLVPRYIAAEVTLSFFGLGS